MSLGYHRKAQKNPEPKETPQEADPLRQKLESEETSSGSKEEQKQALVLNEDSSEEEEANSSVIRQFKQEEVESGEQVIHGFGNLSQLLDGEEEEEEATLEQQDQFNKSQKMPSFLISPRDQAEEDDEEKEEEHEISVINHMQPADQSLDCADTSVINTKQRDLLKSPGQFFSNNPNGTFLMGLNDVTIEKDTFETILKDIYTAHKAETDLLKLELGIHKKIIEKSCTRVKKQSEQIQKLKDTLFLHLMNKQEVKVEKLENRKLKKEIATLEDKIIKMTRVMARFDLEALKQTREEEQQIDLLMMENQKLRDLLKISLKFSGAEKDLEEKLKKQEEIMHEKEQERKENKEGEFAEGYEEDQKLLGKKKPGLTNTIKMKMMERIKQKAENERIKEELKRITEQEFFRYMQ